MILGYDALCDRLYLEQAANLAILSGDGKITKQKQAFLDNREERMLQLIEMMTNETY